MPLPPILLLGNQNAGKSSLFNALTGLRSRVANYPGITTEARVGEIKRFKGEMVQVVDLPGTYSLIPASNEEELTVMALLGMLKSLKEHSLVVVVIDCSELRRGLYLYSQIIELGFKAIIVLSMVDQRSPSWQQQAMSLLQKNCATIIVPVTITDPNSIKRLTNIIDGILAGSFRPQIKELPLLFSGLPSSLVDKINQIGASFPLPQHAENSVDLIRNFNIFLYGLVRKNRLGQTEKNLAHLKLNTKETQILDALINEIPEKRFKKIDEWLGGLKEDHNKGRAISDLVDKIVLHPFIGTLLLFFLLFLMVQSLFVIAKPIADFLGLGVEVIASHVATFLPKESLLRSLIVDGVFLGLGSIVSFMPLIALLFIFLSVLEDSGYLARATYLLDTTMKRLGLSGRSLMPMLSSFACAVPAILAARTISNPKQRLITIMVTPFLVCSARLPIFGLIIAALFSNYPPIFGIFNVGAVLFVSMYALSVFVSLLFAFILSKFLKVEREDNLAIELPPYRWPNIFSVGKRIFDRLYLFARDVGSVILASTIVIWALFHLPSEFSKDGQINPIITNEDFSLSYAGKIGKSLEPLIEPMGLDWRVGVGIVSSFLAREVFVSTMAVVYGLSNSKENSLGLKDSFKKNLSPLSGLSLLVFFTLSMQCMSTLATTRRETGSLLWPALQFIIMTGCGYGLALLSYIIGARFF